MMKLKDILNEDINIQHRDWKLFDRNNKLLLLITFGDDEISKIANQYKKNRNVKNIDEFQKIFENGLKKIIKNIKYNIQIFNNLGAKVIFNVKDKKEAIKLLKVFEKLLKPYTSYFDKNWYKSKEILENITLDVEIGDTILMGKFLNKKVEVKSISKDKHGMPLINGKPITRFRIIKNKNDIKESPDTIGSINLTWEDDGAVPFGYYKNKMRVGPEYETHYDISDLYDDMNGDVYDSPERNDFKYTGRIWVDYEIISFWKYPTPNKMEKVWNDLVKEMKKIHKINIGNYNKYKLETPKGKLIKLSEYIKTAKKLLKRSSSDLNQQHQLSPVAKNKKIPKGVGSKKYPAGMPYTQYKQMTSTSENINEFVDDFDMQKFLNMPSFRKRILYANEKLKKIASGSARIIYKIDDNTVLKLAKNKKGLAQNSVESDGVLNDWYSDIITGVIESDNDDRWIISNKAKRITKNRFKSLLGVSIEDFYSYICDRVGKKNYQPKPDVDIIEKLDNSEFAQSVLDMIVNFDMEIRDFDRISTYGELNGKLVISDYGLTKAVWEEYYK